MHGACMEPLPPPARPANRTCLPFVAPLASDFPADHRHALPRLHHAGIVTTIPCQSCRDLPHAGIATEASSCIHATTATPCKPAASLAYELFLPDRHARASYAYLDSHLAQRPPDLARKPLVTMLSILSAQIYRHATLPALRFCIFLPLSPYIVNLGAAWR